MRWGAVVGVLVGCSFSGPSSSAPDAGGDALAGCTVHGLGFGDLCAGDDLGVASIDDFRLINTTTGAITDAGDQELEIRCVHQALGGRDVCALWFDDLDVQADVRIVGDRPLVIVSSREIRVQVGAALLAGSGDHGGVVASGPGANPSDCDGLGAGGPGEQGTDRGSGGGGGGGFQTAGEVGGVGSDGRIGAGAGGEAGQVANAPTALRGGCPGGDGGADEYRGIGGAGGGALYLAADQIRIEGVVDAGGAGGIGGLFLSAAREGGGGGGGSGGLIVLDGAVEITGVASAAGGAGGQGAESDGGAQDGSDGEDGRDDGVPAAGGAQGPGGAGGDGAAGPIAAGAGEDKEDGGGGAGGGGGYIIEL